MPIIYLKAIMAVLVLALCVLLYLGARELRILPAFNVPRLRMPVMQLRLALPSFREEPEESDPEADRQAAERASQLAASRLTAELSGDSGPQPESYLEEMMYGLENAFDSFEAGRISAAAYRSILLTEKRAAVRRRTGLAARDEVNASEAEAHALELSQANAAVESIEWCLSWIDEMEQLQVSEPCAPDQPDMALMAYS